MIGLLLTVQFFCKQPIDGTVGASAGTIAPLYCTAVLHLCIAPLYLAKET